LTGINHSGESGSKSQRNGCSWGGRSPFGDLVGKHMFDPSQSAIDTFAYQCQHTLGGCPEPEF
jgi:hypothetical protein